MDELISRQAATTIPQVMPKEKEQHGRTFQEIVVEYPSYCIYPEYKGKPYFSIKYTENGQEFIGYGTFKPEVLSELLKEYFMPYAQPVNDDLIQKIEEGIKATTPTDEYMVGMRNGMKWCKSLLDGKEPEYDIVQPNHNAEPSKMVDDTISRQAAIDALDCINGVEEVLRSLPSAQPTNEMLERCKFEYIHACKIVSIPTPDVTGKDKQDAYAVIKALHPIFGDVPFAKVKRGDSDAAD